MKSPTAGSTNTKSPDQVAKDRLALAREKPTRKRRFSGRLLSPIILSPAMTLIVIFVYVFIAITIWVSLSNWGTLKVDMSIRQPLGFTYQQMFSMTRWHANLRNVFVFTALFLSFSLGFGLLLALLLDRKLIGYTFFRNVFLFPYALSFIVTGVAWRWIFNPEKGVNVLFDTLGINKLIEHFGGPPLHPGWVTDTTVLFSLNSWLGTMHLQQK